MSLSQINTPFVKIKKHKHKLSSATQTERLNDTVTYVNNTERQGSENRIKQKAVRCNGVTKVSENRPDKGHSRFNIS